MAETPRGVLLKRFTAGQKIQSWPTDTWSKVLDHVEGPHTPIPEGQSQNAVAPFALYSWCTNISATAIPAGGVGGIESVMNDPNTFTDDQLAVVAGPQFKVTDPDRARHVRNWVTFPGGCPSGELGLGVVMGNTYAMVEVISQSHQHVGLSDGDNTKLVTQMGGMARLLWPRRGLDVDLVGQTLWLPIQMTGEESSPLIRASAPTAITDGTSGPVDLTDNGGTAGLQITAHLVWMNQTAEDVAQGDDVGTYYWDEPDQSIIVMAPCPPSA